MQYEVGKTYIEDVEPDIGGRGLHAISPTAAPLSILEKYPPSWNGNPDRYCEVKISGKISDDGYVIAANKLTVIKEIGIPDFMEAHLEWINKHITEEFTGEENSNVSGCNRSRVIGDSYSSINGGYGSFVSGSYRCSVSGGDCSSVSGGNYSIVSGGNYSIVNSGRTSIVSGGRCSIVSGEQDSIVSGGNDSVVTGGKKSRLSGGGFSIVTGGDYSIVSGGICSCVSGGIQSIAASGGSSSVSDQGVAVARGPYVKVKGGLGALLVIAKETIDDDRIREWKAAIVDGINIKPDTWYTIKDGELVEVEE